MATPIDLSVLIPVRATTEEHVQWLHEAVQSAVKQSYPVKQIIVCDDHSGYDLELQELSSQCQVYTLDGKRSGVCAARNLLGWLCQTEYLLFLDADDRLMEGALEQMAAYAAPDAVVFSDLRVFGNGHAVKYHAFPEWSSDGLFRGAIMPITSIHTKAAFEKIGGFDPAFEELLEDWDYNIRLMVAGFCGIRIPLPLLEYRRHSTARSWKDRNVLYHMRTLLQSKYTAIKEKEMPCSGCGKRNPGGRPRSSQFKLRTPLPSGALVLVEYTGNRRGTFTLRGKATGTHYRFAATELHRQRWVYREDAVELVRLPSFHSISQKSEQPVVEEDYRIESKAKPTRPDDLTVLAGVSIKRAEQLTASGITTFETLAVLQPSEIAGLLKGVGEKTAEKWITQAQELRDGDK